MKNIFLALALVLLTITVTAQGADYWQQRVEYMMEVDVDVKNYQYDGSMYITYTNNSPDTLDRIFFHLYFNAFQPGSMMDIRSRTISDPDRRVGGRIAQLDETQIGYIDVRDVRQEGKPLDYETVGTICEVSLLDQLLPGKTCQFSMGWKAQLPLQKITTGTNNSPDTLDRIFFHLYFNAFQPGSMMDIRSRTITDPDRRVGGRIAQLDETQIGYIDVRDVRQEGKPLDYETVGTICEVSLLEQLLPGKTCQFSMGWKAQVPLQIRRSGRNNSEGIDFSMAQWYPKLCEYDKQGWHANPYIGREFHGVWGDFDVKINIDKNYTIGATGILQNKDEIGHGYSEAKGKVKKGKLNWHFKAENVHDFVWAADPDYIHDIVKDGDLEFHFFYLDDDAIKKNWKILQEKTPEIFRLASEQFGEYPYKKYSVIQGGDGGMEYPMATLITGNRKERSLVGVTVHEVMHSWYQMTLGTNEALYPWMDEGFTSYTSTIIMNQLYPPSEEPMNAHFRSYQSYLNLVRDGKDEGMDTHADHYKTNRAYGVNAYSKGEVFLKQLEYIIGEKALAETMLRYYNEWKFKHPTDKDFIRVAEKVSGLELDWYHEYFVSSRKTIDYAISDVKAEGSKTNVYLERKGDMIMPLDVLVYMLDGTVVQYNIPLRIMRGEKNEEVDGLKIITAPDWPWTHPGYVLTINYPAKMIDAIEIDPTMRMADTDRSNNISGATGGSDDFFYQEK